MKVYNLFLIKKDVKIMYENNQKSLFMYLKKLYYLKGNFNYGINLFEQVCCYVHINVLKDYFNKKYNFNFNKSFLYKNSKIIIRKTRIIIITQSKLPNIMNIFDIYNKNIFVCDFENNNFFLLNDLKYFFLQTG